MPSTVATSAGISLEPAAYAGALLDRPQPHTERAARVLAGNFCRLRLYSASRLVNPPRVDRLISHHKESSLSPHGLEQLLIKTDWRNRDSAYEFYQQWRDIIRSWSNSSQNIGWPLIGKYLIQHLSPARLPDACRELLAAGEQLIDAARDDINHSIIFVFKLLPKPERLGIILQLLGPGRRQSPGSRAWLLDQLSLEVYLLPPKDIIAALSVLLHQLAFAARDVQIRVFRELVYQPKHIALGGNNQAVYNSLVEFYQRHLQRPLKSIKL